MQRLILKQILMVLHIMRTLHQTIKKMVVARVVVMKAVVEATLHLKGILLLRQRHQKGLLHQLHLKDLAETVAVTMAAVLETTAEMVAVPAEVVAVALAAQEVEVQAAAVVVPVEVVEVQAAEEAAVLAAPVVVAAARAEADIVVAAPVATILAVETATLVEAELMTREFNLMKVLLVIVKLILMMKKEAAMRKPRMKVKTQMPVRLLKKRKKLK